MSGSIWDGTLASFRDQVGSGQPMPAGVSVAAVTASFGLGLLIKVLTISHQRSDLVEAARRESDRLARAAEEDIIAFNRREKAGMIEVPMNAARAAAAGLDLCAEVADVIRGHIAADLGVAAILLSGAVRAMLLCVDFNKAPASPERTELEQRAMRQAETVLDRISRSG
jgi:formiminotetrahydrofolate cyclodeaminase